MCMDKTRVIVCNTPGAGSTHFRDLQTIANDVRKAKFEHAA